MGAPPNPFSPEAIQAHKARREAKKDQERQTLTAVEIVPGAPRDQVEALLADWIAQSPFVFAEGLSSLAAVLEDYAGALKEAPSAVDMEGAFQAYSRGKALEDAGKHLAGAVKDRLLELADPDDKAQQKRVSVTTPSGATFKVGYTPAQERVRVKDLEANYPEFMHTLRREGVAYTAARSKAVYLVRETKKSTVKTTDAKE